MILGLGKSFPVKSPEALGSLGFTYFMDGTTLDIENLLRTFVRTRVNLVMLCEDGVM